jgi:SAM-dependent methyltransferase
MRQLLRGLPASAQRALDVGCGEGTLTRALRREIPAVIGLDVDVPSVQLAKQQQSAEQQVLYVVGDLLRHPFAPASFDVVISSAALHHVDAAAGIAAMKELLVLGGLLVVVGVARTVLPRDVGWEAAAIVAHRWQRSRRPYWEHSAPKLWPPPLTHAQMRRLARAALPGARYRRHLLWRYSIVWTKPAGPNLFDTAALIG